MTVALGMDALGRRNGQIAAKVFLAAGTVKNYASRIMDKLNAESPHHPAACVRVRPR